MLLLPSEVTKQRPPKSEAVPASVPMTDSDGYLLPTGKTAVDVGHGREGGEEGGGRGRHWLQKTLGSLGKRAVVLVNAGECFLPIM